MKIYFDTLDNNQSNQNDLAFNGTNDYWLIAPGAPIKKVAQEMKFDLSLLGDINEPGIYFVDVRGDPQWWAGVLQNIGAPDKHILECLPEQIINLVKDKKLRLVINADREGGPMVTQDWDCFLSTYNCVNKLKLPSNSVLILQGNEKISRQYNKWLKKHNFPKVYDVMYSNHFGHIFVDNNMVTTPVIKYAMANPNAKDFNSLNRVYRPQRGAHMYRCIKDNILSKGIVSGNQIQLHDQETLLLLGEDYSEIKKYFPRFVDGDWSNTNAANQYNTEIYENSLLSVITETIFIHDVAFITEKIFKPIMLGHPLILFASQGTLRSLADMGFKIDWCDIDPSYNDITDPVERFNTTQNVLKNWCNLKPEEKIAKLEKSFDTIQYNFDLIRSRDFYKEAIQFAVDNTKEYFNETI